MNRLTAANIGVHTVDAFHVVTRPAEIKRYIKISLYVCGRPLLLLPSRCARFAVMVAANRSVWLIWLHRVGYLTTVLIAAELIFITTIMVKGWLHDREVLESRASRPVPCEARADGGLSTLLCEQLRRLPDGAGDSGDAFLIAPMPSLGLDDTDYAIALWRPEGSSDAVGELIARSKVRTDTPVIHRKSFTLPASAYADLTSQVDPIVTDWNGEMGCLDGTPTMFERYRGSEVISGRGNCAESIQELRQLSLQIVRRFSHDAALPDDASWYSW